MKKRILIALIIAILSQTYASAACLDFSTNLSRGAESNLVLQVQNFLYAKGILKAVPNGYFGPATLNAVKAYQKSVGLSQVGNTGPATRAAIKKESCTTSGTTSTSPSSQNPMQNQVSSGVSSAQPVAQTAFVSRPQLNSIDLVGLFAGGTTDWGFSLYGNNFSTSSNKVVFKHQGTRVEYEIGTFASASGTIALPTNITGTLFVCGAGCKETLPAGSYDVFVSTAGGTSDAKLITVHPFTLSVQSLAFSTLPAKGTSSKIATVSFSASLPVIVRSLAFTVATSTISSGGVGNIVLKDEIAGGNFAQNKELGPFQTVFVSTYVDTNNTNAGDFSGIFSVSIEDYMGKRKTTFTSKPILATVNGII